MPDPMQCNERADPNAAIHSLDVLVKVGNDRAPSSAKLLTQIPPGAMERLPQVPLGIQVLQGPGIPTLAWLVCACDSNGGIVTRPGRPRHCLARHPTGILEPQHAGRFQLTLGPLAIGHGGTAITRDMQPSESPVLSRVEPEHESDNLAVGGGDPLRPRQWMVA